MFRIELNKQINIAAGPEIRSQRRPKNRKPQNMVSSAIIGKVYSVELNLRHFSAIKFPVFFDIISCRRFNNTCNNHLLSGLRNRLARPGQSSKR